MAKHIQLNVENPCHENWENMTASEKGRFCGSCQKQVVDFTSMSDSRIAAFFKKPSTGSVCGRFMADQLERDIEMPGKRIPWLKYFFTVALPAFLVSRTAAQETKRPLMGDTTLVCEKPILPQRDQIQLMGDVDPARDVKNPLHTINGSVINSQGEPVQWATITVKGTNKTAVTNELGYFKLLHDRTTKEVVLLISAVGYKDKEFKLVPAQQKATIRMIVEESVLGEVIILAGLTTVRRSEPSPVIPILGTFLFDSAARFARAYPNPITAGDPLTIECKKVAKGEYTFELLNASSQILLQKIVSVDNEKQAVQMNTPLVKPGVYYLKITDKKTGKSVAEKILIQ
jgi:hypothetical protein